MDFTWAALQTQKTCRPVQARVRYKEIALRSMEADERFRWLEARVSSSLRPRGEDLRRMTVDEDNRATFLSFCNHSESRCIFVHVVRTDAGDGEVIKVSSSPPSRVNDKAMVFLKCCHASKLTRDNLAQDVIYSECSTSPLAHLDLVMQEVYLPLMTSSGGSSTHANDNLLDLLHRISSSMQVTNGYSQGKVVLPLPSVATLARTAFTSPDRHSVVVHVLETAVVMWMKQVKMALYCDPTGAICRKAGKYAGPLEEIKFWEARQQRLESVREQLSSIPILTILHNLEVMHSTYAQGFSHAQHNITQAAQEAEHCLGFLRTWKPWLVRLHNAHHPCTITTSFPPIMAVLLLIWQHSGYYGQKPTFHRLLTLLANKVVTKTREIVGSDLLDNPLKSLSDLKLALRVCAAFRGCYLDYKERADTWLKTEAPSAAGGQETGSVVSTGGKRSGETHCGWPLRNSKVFHALNAVMERCNDLSELVHTTHEFSELGSVGVGGGGGMTNTEVVIGDIYSKFTEAVQVFSSDKLDLLGVGGEGHFESRFFTFRRSVQSLERQLGREIGAWLQRSPSLQAKLRIVELFACTSRRETVRAILSPHHEAVMRAILTDIQDVLSILTSSHPPLLPHTPPTTTRLLWLHALGERASGSVSVVRSAAPELLEGELGWKLRQTYSELTEKLHSCREEEERKWVEGVPSGLNKRLSDTVLRRGPDGELVVNFDPTLHKVLCEARHLSHPPLSLRMPPPIKVLTKTTDLEELRYRWASLELVLQVYHDTVGALREEERLLLEGKLKHINTLLSDGEKVVNWLSPGFPDFLAQIKMAVCTDLTSSLSTLHTFSSSLAQITASWSQIPGLDIFTGDGESTLEGLQTKHNAVIERLSSLLPSSLSRLTAHLVAVQSQIHASPESPAWDQFLQVAEERVREGLVAMILTAVGSLLHRAQLYEQGVSIPPLMVVRLELVGSAVMFSPPLTPHSSLPSIPEIVASWMDSYVATTRHLPRILPGTKESYQELLTSDPRVRGALGKVTAHLETNSRQAQNLRSKFSQFCFLWEQDVQQTFCAFLAGEAPPHPKRLSRPETVRSRSSARPHSSGSSTRPKSSQVSISQHSLPGPTPAMNQVTGVCDWDFLCPPGMEPDPNDDISKRPSLEEFDGELAIFQGISDRLSGTEDDCNVGWLTANQRPIKDILNTLVSKWKAVYAGYLERQMSVMLNTLDQFLHEVEPEVERMGGEGEDSLSLMSLMTIFNRVNGQQVEMDKKFGTVHRAYAMLDKFSHPLPQRLRDQFNTAPHRWSNLKKRISLGKQRMGPCIQSQSQTITADLAQFGQHYSSLHARFEYSECLRHDCGSEVMREGVRGVERELRDLQSEACNLIELQELLGTSVFNFSLLNEFQRELSTLSELWTFYESVMREHSVWQESEWRVVECHEVEETTQSQLASLQALPLFTHSWDLHQHLASFLLATQLSLPLVEGLRGSAIRSRHWKQVLRLACPSSLATLQLVSRGGGLNNCALENLTLCQLMSLELHKHRDEVLQVVDRANKEVAIEALLNSFEEVWLSRQLELLAPERQPLPISRQETVMELGLEGHLPPAASKPRVSSAKVSSILRRSQSTTKPTSPTHFSPPPPLSPPEPSRSPLCLLSNTDRLFETLESHQTSLQSVMGTTAAASFTDDLHRWQKQLQTIEAVLGVWLQVQTLWTQLEVYQRAEVQQHLPAQSFTFSSVDKEWRELVESATANPSVMAVCLKEGLLGQLEKLQTSLLQCRSALVGYAEGQRDKCHWFHFIPLDDVLQFVCCGSRVDQLSSLIHKLLPHASGLLYTHGPPSSSSPSTPHHHLPRITGVISNLGERLELQQSVACGGTMENIITSLFSSLHSTLRSQLSSAITLLTPSSPSLSLLPTLWSSGLSTQIILLATQITLDMALETSHRTATESGEKTSLESLCEEIKELVTKAVRQLQVYPGQSVRSENGPGEEGVMKEPGGAGIASASVTREQANHLKSVIFALSSCLQRAVECLQQTTKNTGNADFLKQHGRLQWVWSGDNEEACHLTTVGARLSYSYHYVGGGSRLVLTPATERTLVFLLRAVHHGHHSLLTGPEASGGSSLVMELAAMTGRPLFSLHCTPHTSSCTVINCLQGSALTGCWLLLQSVDSLSLPALHTLSVLLPQLTLACQTQASSLGDGSLSLPPSVTPGVCFSTTFTPTTTAAKLQPELRRVFLTASVARPETRMLVEALLLAHHFQNHGRLSRTLDTLLTSVEELFNNQVSVNGEGQSRTVRMAKDDTGGPIISLGLGVLEAVVASGQRYMTEFERLGVLQWSEGGGRGEGGGGGLRDRSLVLSDVSEGARASLRLRASSVDQSQEPSLIQGSLEELCLLLSLKDHLLPQLSHSTTSLDAFLLLLSDHFPTCNVPELLAHESGLREELAGRAERDREEAGNSARESRAASAMMVVREDMRPPSEVMTSQEEQIVQACLLDNHVPSPSFQLAVSQLLSLTQSHVVVAVVGGVCSGKSRVIKVAADTLRGQGAGLTLSWIFPGALDEGQLFGQELKKRWQEGLLPQLVTRSREEGRGGGGGGGGEGGSGGRWVVLDGPLSPHHLETLLTLCDSDRLIKLSNGRGIPIDSSYRFILELSSLDSLTPGASATLPRLCLPPSVVSWWDPVSRWLLTQPREKATALEQHLRRLLPLCLEFLTPVLARGGETPPSQESSASSLSGGVTGPQFKLSHQDLRLHPVHLVTTCCTILEVSLSSCSTPPPTQEDLLPHLAYSLVWSLGGHLSLTNKLVFDKWWRHTFTDPGLALPAPGLIWDYCPDPGTPGFVPCSSTHLAISSSLSPGFTADSPPPFVSTRRADAVANVIYKLVSQGHPVLLVGSVGSGKTALLQQTLSKITSTDMALQHYYTSQFTSGQSFWSCMKEQLEWKWGRNFAPCGTCGKRLVCFLDDLHNSATAGSSLGEMVRCHLSTGGVWEGGASCQSQCWHHVANTSYVCTTSIFPDSGGEHHPLDLRLAGHFSVIHWDGYDSADLETIFSSILSPHLSSTSLAVAGVGERLVEVAVQVHRTLSSLFLPSPTRQHYLFNLRHIAGIFRQLCGWCSSEEGEVSERGLVTAWLRESWWTYSGALSSPVDRERYQEVVSHSLRKHFCQSDLLPQLLQPTSHQLTSSQKETLVRQLQQQLSHHPGLHVNLYDNVLEEINRLCQLMRSPFDLSHMVLVGHAHPDPLVGLAAVHCGYTVVRPSVYFSPSLLTSSCSPFGMSPASYCEESLRNDLCTLYTEAGVKNQQVLLLVTSVEMLHASFLGLLYEAVCHGHITHLFPPEERTRIVSAVRSDVTRAGIVFSPSTAWQFFLSRVRQNLRIVLATPDLRPQEGEERLCAHWREFLGRVNIHYHQPWSQRDLVNVALHHLSAVSVLGPSLRESVAHMLAAIHLQLRTRPGLLPAYNSTFQYLVEWFVEKLQVRHGYQEELSGKLRGAMECVERARQRGGEVGERLGREERVLEEREEAYRKALVQLGQDTAISQEQSRLVARQRHRVDDLRKVIPQYEMGLQMAGEEKLSLVLHLKRQVININHSSLTELRAQQRPPQIIEDLLSAVISIVKSPSADLSWTKGAKRLMANIDRFQELLLGSSQSESDSVTILASVDPIINRVAPSVDELGSYPGGLAATQLLEWAQGVVKLHSLLETQVRPLEEKVAAMGSSLAECEEKLRQQEDKMNVLGRRVQGLSEGLESAAVQCSMQRDTVQGMKEQLTEIQNFVEVLAAHYDKWREELSAADHALSQELGSLAISACVPVYLASLPPHTQLDTLNTLLLPLLRERGIPTVWGDQLSTAVGSFCQPRTSSSDFSSSYPALCRAVLPHLSSPSFRERWLEEGQCLPAVLSMSLAALSWRHALLIHDPEDTVGRWLRGWKGEELMVVDYRERDLKFYLTVEQALLCGDPLLVERVAPPIDPTLQPLLEMIISWNNSEQNPVEFCGRKILANPGFSLYLTTSLPLSSFPPTLTCITCPLDFSLSQPWTQELLFQTACSVADSSPDQLDKMVCEVVKEEGKVEGMKAELPSLLSPSTHNYCSLTERVTSTIHTWKQAEDTYTTLKTKLEGYTASKSHLASLAHMSSLILDLLHQCSPHQTPVVSLSLFQRHLSSVLRNSEEPDGEIEILGSLATAIEATAGVLGTAAVSEAEREEREGEWRSVVLQELMLAAVKDMACVLNPSQCEVLACALYIMSTVPPHTPPSLLLEQLSFLLEGREGYLVSTKDDIVSSLPSCPTSIPHDFWVALHVAPFSKSYFSRHVAPSAHSESDREFWLGIQDERGRSISAFPWRVNHRCPETLGDLLMLTLVHQPTAMEVVSAATARLINSVRPHPLSQLLQAPDEEWVGKPLLLLNEPDELQSQLNLLLLQDELQRISGKPVRVMNIATATDMEGECPCLSEDVSMTAGTLLVTGLGHCHTKWLPFATAKMQNVCLKGGVVVAVVEADSPAVAVLSRFCRVTRLSHLAIPPPPSTHTTLPLSSLPGHSRVLLDLLHLLTALPHLPSSSQLAPSSHPLLFHLSLLHCSIHCYCKLTGRPIPPLPLFTSSLSLLPTLTQDSQPLAHTVSDLQHHTLSLYNPVCSGPVLEGLIASCLDSSVLEAPGGKLTLVLGEYGELEVVTPGPGVPVENYGDHVMGMMSSEIHQRTDTLLSKQTLSSAVTDLLVPIITKLPEDTLSPPPTSSKAMDSIS